MDTVNIGELVSACIDLAQLAGELIRRDYASGDLGVVLKGFTANGVEDPLTNADLHSQQFIISNIRTVWPSIPIVAEEDCEVPKSTHVPRLDLISVHLPPSLSQVPLRRVVVFIDPLDATREFTKGHVECVMTLIGVSIDGVPVAGVIHQPFVGYSGKTVWGIVNVGTGGIVRDPPHDGLILVTTASHGSEIVENAIGKIKPDKVIRAGGAGFKTLMVLEGKADVYVFPTPGCKLWDTCAPHAILLAAGGTMTDAKGDEIKYHADSDVQVSNGVVASMSNQDKYIQSITSL